MKVKKTVFQLFVMLLAVTMLSTFAVAKSHKKYMNKKVEKEFKGVKKQIEALYEILADLQAQIDNGAVGNPGDQTDDTGIGDEDALPAEPRFMCPGCTFPAGELPEDVKARLPGAYLPNANFSGTDLTGVDLSEAELSQVLWYLTTCPDGSDSSSHPGGLWDYGTCEGHLIP